MITKFQTKNKKIYISDIKIKKLIFFKNTKYSSDLLELIKNMGGIGEFLFATTLGFAFSYYMPNKYYKNFSSEVFLPI